MDLTILNILIMNSWWMLFSLLFFLIGLNRLGRIFLYMIGFLWLVKLVGWVVGWAVN